MTIQDLNNQIKSLTANSGDALKQLQEEIIRLKQEHESDIKNHQENFAR
jgi:hypothetical protein